MSSEPTGIVARIIELLKEHSDGLTSGEIRAKLAVAADEQAQLDTRPRDIRKWYELVTVPNGGNPRYKLGERKAQNSESKINGRLRAEVLRLARGRCQMCGKTVTEDGVKLQVDHKLPQTWGGTDEIDNLWALCTECNHGKKNLFSNQPDGIKEVLIHRSVHVRIGELLKQNFGEPVAAKMLEFVANQDDWKKRTRELRYLGWDIEVTKKKQPNGRVMSYYTLKEFHKWPEDPTAWIRKFEKDREQSNRSAAESDAAD